MYLKNLFVTAKGLLVFLGSTFKGDDLFMALTVNQTHMILTLLSNRLSGERDVVKISQILKDFEAAFIVDIPTWKSDLKTYLKKELYGNTALGVLKQWQ